MLVGKLMFFAISIIYSIYMYSYSKWEKNVNKNKFGSFIIKASITANIIAIIISFFGELYYNC